MKKALFFCLLLAILPLSACNNPLDTESYAKEICLKDGYNESVPAKIGGKIVGFNCCHANGNWLDCDRYYSYDSEKDEFVFE